ncbi:MAG TPA: carboxypeptidase-like regulatory domain-containing protein, partial [Ktedonobacterales bacterium]|nr:carboxypeptidase-like regulatory domain-containing protein [Ktedonobacterales bacterium]
HVQCNSISTRANSDGAFALILPSANWYDCEITAPPIYVALSIALQNPHHGTAITLNLESTSAPICVPSADLGQVACPPLSLAGGAMSGTVMAQDTHAAVANASISCTEVQSLHVAVTNGSEPTWFTSTTDQRGSFLLPGLPVNTYKCMVTSPASDAFVQQQQILVAPGATAQVEFTECAQCQGFQYHGGPVMHTLTAYLIFWLPPNYTFDPSLGDSYFESRMSNYFRDIGGSSFYALVTQYYDYSGPIQNSVTLGGVYLDTQPYGVAATQSDPIHDADVRGEIERVRAKQNWPTGLNAEYFVFAGDGAQLCQENGPTVNTYCTFANQGKSLCGYHNYIQDYSQPNAPVIYAYLADAGDMPLCAFSGPRLPNGDGLIDGELDTVSHENFESVTDPLWYTPGTPGWYRDNAAHSANNMEMGDICQGYVYSTFYDGGNVTLNNNRDYLLQHEWSNSADGCAWQ